MQALNVVVEKKCDTTQTNAAFYNNIEVIDRKEIICEVRDA